MKKDKADLTIIIVNWNTEQYLANCLKSLFDQKQNIDYEVIVVDNGSKDASIRIIKEKFPQARLVENNANLGFSKANNQGLKLADSRYMMLLNPDTIVKEGTLGKLVNFLEENPEACAVGPKLLNPDGTTQREGYYRRFPTILQVTLFYTPLRRLALRIPFLVKKFWENFDENHTCEVEQIPGAALCLRREALDKVGVLEERYPIWFEDVDWCYRARKLGFKLIFYPEAEITHFGGGSFALWSEKEKMLRLFSSMYIFFKLNHGFLKAELVRLIVLISTVASISLNFIRKTFNLKGFKKEDYEARTWFLTRFLKGETSHELPTL